MPAYAIKCVPDSLYFLYTVINQDASDREQSVVNASFVGSVQR